MRATATTLLLTALLLVLLPTAALAHASFDLRQVPAGSTQELVLRVPLERDAVNDLVEVLVPGGFTVEDCAATEGWTCDRDETADGDTVLTLRRGPDGAGDTERFAVSLTAPTAEGVYAFPTIQTYDDGVEASWIGAPDSDQPAPRIQVGDSTAPVESNEDATPHTPLASTGPSTDAGPTPASSPSAATTPSPAATEDAAPPAASDESSSGPSPVLVVVGIALAAVAIAGAVARFRSL